MDEIIYFSDNIYYHALTCGSLSHLPVMTKSLDSSLLTIKYENEYSGFLMGQLLNDPVLTE